MPATVHHVNPLPPAVADAHEMVRASARIDIVRWLLSHPGSLTSDVVRAIGSQRITTRQHLVALESIHVVNISLPEGERERRQVRYSADPERVSTLLRALTDYIVTGS